MRILLAGGTGLIGRAFIDATSGTAISTELILRRSNERWPNLTQHIIDFDQVEDMRLEGHFDAVVCCLGTTIKKAGSQEAFRKVDHDYVVGLAKWCENNKVNHFAVISSIGANASSSNFYLRTKGEMEVAVTACDIPSISILRPSLLLGNREEFRLGETIGKVVLTTLSPLLLGSLRKQRPVSDTTVAQKLVRIVEQPIEGVQIFESVDLKD